LNTLLKKLKIGEFGQVLVKFVSSQLIYNALRMIAGFMVVKLVLPEIFGLFSGVGIFLGYILLGHGGILNGLGRELPFQLGQNNKSNVDKLSSLGFFVSLFIGVIASIVFFYFFLVAFANNDTNLTIVYAAYIIIAFFHTLNKAYLPVLYRTNNDFDLLSKINIYFALINIVSVIMVWQFNLLGLALRGVLLSLVEFALLFKNRPIKSKPKWDNNVAKELINTGLPIFAVGQIQPMWKTILNSMIFSIGGAISFGYYALANIVNGAIGIVPKAVSAVVYPRMSIQFGQGNSVKSIVMQVVKPTLFQFISLLGVAIISYFLLPILVEAYLPKYINGVEVAQWTLFIPVAASLGLVNNIYNVIKKQNFYFISLIIGAILGTVYILLMIKLTGFNLVLFPQGIIIGTIIQVVLSLYFINRMIKH